MVSCKAEVDAESPLATATVSVAAGFEAVCASVVEGFAAASTKIDVPTAERSLAIMIGNPL
jgi:hypothetical protein